MPFFEVWGVSSEAPATLCQLRDAIVEVCIGIEELHLSAQDVSVFIPTDVIGSDPNGVAIVRIRDLFRTHERTTEVLERFSAIIGAAVFSVLGMQWKKVEIPVVETVEPDSVRVTLRVWSRQ